VRIILVVLFLSISVLKAQDYRFNNFQSSAAGTNPALIGTFEGNVRVVFQYRSLFTSILGQEGFKGMVVSGEYNLPNSKGDFWGFGIQAFQHQAGYSRFNSEGILGSLSFGKKLSDQRYSGMNHYIVAGFQAGMGQNRISNPNLWFSSQWDIPGSFIDFEKNSEELLLTGRSKIFPDLNAGLLWFATFQKNNSVYLGGSIYHILEPQISLVENNDFNLQRRISIHGGADLSISKTLSIMPSMGFMQQYRQMSSILGGFLRYRSKNEEDMNFKMGLHSHFSNSLDRNFRPEALAISTVFEKSPMSLALVYDFTLSELSSLNSGRGAFELVLSYTGRRDRPSKMKIPQF
jgi:type IX secretion system PorP/SprF family membrane protein